MSKVMLTSYDLVKITEKCRDIAAKGLSNHLKAIIQPLNVVLVSPPHDFIGISNNPAIYVSKQTQLLLTKYHYAWEIDKTIVVRAACLDEDTLHLVGVMCHEVGHAFNVYAKIANTESNAYVFEIETLCQLFNRQDKFLNNYTEQDILQYFQNRMSNYRGFGLTQNKHLAVLLGAINDGTIFELLKKQNNVHQEYLSTSRFRVFATKNRISNYSEYYEKQNRIL